MQNHKEHKKKGEKLKYVKRECGYRKWKWAKRVDWKVNVQKVSLNFQLISDLINNWMVKQQQLKKDDDDDDELN